MRANFTVLKLFSIQATIAMRYSTLCIACFVCLSAAAQPYLIGSRQLDLFDAARNRTITTKLYYPADVAGSNATVAAGAFPVLVVGHGFVMNVDAYANLWNHFVPLGYIVALPNTETGFAPDHATFGADIAYVGTAMQAENTAAASPFFGHVAPATALMGHSMGGGSAVLGAANNSGIQALVVFAPAETNPSAVAAAPNVSVPTLIFAASEDCVTPIAAHTAPMYAALVVPCRAFVNILGGGHCQFAESNFNCNFGELTCGPNLTISRAQQHDVMNDFAGLWLDHFLRGDQQALGVVLDSMALSTRVQADHTCISTRIRPERAISWSIHPSVAADRIYLTGLSPNAVLRVLDASGRVILAPRSVGGSPVVDVSRLHAGSYHLSVSESGTTTVRPFMVVR